jgi:hypothetical protein
LAILGGFDLNLVAVSPTLFRGGPPMNAGKTLFTQLLDCLRWSTFARIVARYHGDHSVQTVPMHRTIPGLRDIETCLSAQPAKLRHMGVSRAGPAFDPR